MKSFFTILAGFVFGGVVFVSATYNLYPPDPAFYLSYGGTLLLASVISLISALVFFGFFHLFKVRVENTLLLGATALVTQIAIYLITHTILFNLGTLGFGIAVIILSAIACFVLDKFARG